MPVDDDLALPKHAGQLDHWQGRYRRRVLRTARESVSGFRDSRTRTEAHLNKHESRRRLDADEKSPEE